MIRKSSVPKTIIAYELLLGLFETASGFGILFFGRSLLGIYENLKNAELLEDPNDLFVRISEKLIPNLFTHRYYITLFLFAFAAIKLTSGIGLIYKKLWAEYLLVIFLTILIPLDLIEEVIHLSWLKALYLVVNIFIILYLTKFKPIEYLKKLKNYIQK